MKDNLTLSMFAQNANKPQSKQAESIALLEINSSISKGSNEMFNKYGIKTKIVECLYTNKAGFESTVYFYSEVYEIIKAVKNIKFTRYRIAITTQSDKLKYWLNLANETKKELVHNVDLCTDKIKFLN